MNRALFKLVLDQIKTHPNTWDQTCWHCSTKHCFAGWTEILLGHKPHRANHLTLERAQAGLRLTAIEAEYLFAHDRIIADFEAMLK